MIKQNPSSKRRSLRPDAASSRRWRAPAAACGLLACGLLAGCGAAGAAAGTDTGAASQGGGQGQSITLYSGQHEQTTNGLVTAFEKQTGIKVSVRNDDEDTLANLIAVQGSHIAGRRLLHRELAPARVPPGEGPAVEGHARHAGANPGQVQLAGRRLGRGVRPGQRDRLQPVS